MALLQLGLLGVCRERLQWQHVSNFKPGFAEIFVKKALGDPVSLDFLRPNFEKYVDVTSWCGYLVIARPPLARGAVVL